MNIEHYSFGEITIDGKRYESDLLIYPDGTIDDSWWREDGHELRMQDIRKLLESDPKVIVVGTGANGMMRPQSGLARRLRDAGIQPVFRATEEATRVFNKMSAEEKTAACLHLTC